MYRHRRPPVPPFSRRPRERLHSSPMRFLGPLLRNVALALAVTALLDWWLGTSSLPLTGDQREALAISFCVGWVLEVGLVAVVLAATTAPLRRALARPAGAAESFAAASGAHRVPA